jgi:hypothetical protein
LDLHLHGEFLMAAIVTFRRSVGMAASRPRA